MGKGIVKLGEGNWAVKDGNLLAAKETNGRFKNAEFTVARGTRSTYVGRDGLIKESNLQDANLVQNGDFSELGSELVTNGDFATDSDWTKSNATISGGKGNLDGNGQTSMLWQDILTNGNSYKATFTVSSYNELGQAKIINNNASTIYTISSDGTFTINFTHSIANGNFIFRATSGAVFSVDNVSVKQVDPNDRWSFSNVGGTHGWRIADGRAICDTNAVTANRNFASSLSLDGSKDYKLTLDILQSADNITVYVGGTSLSTTLPTGENLGYEYYISSADHSGGALMFYAGSSDLQEIDNVSVKEIKTDTPRIDFTDNTDGHLLLEPQSTNLVTYSEDFSQWTLGSNATLTYESDVVAPNGSLGVYRLTLPATSSTFLLSNIFSGQNPLALSIYAKSASTNNNFNLYDGSNSSSLKTATSEWQRFDYVGNGNQLAVINSGDTFITDIYIWGAQAEALSYATSYIPTNGSTVTRDGETCAGAGEAIDFNSEEGVLYAEIAALANDGTFRMIGVSDGTENNVVNFYYRTDANKITVRLKSGGSQVIFESFDITATNFSKVAFRYKSGESNLFIDGVKQKASDYTTTNMPSGLNELAFDSGGGGQFFYGKCKAVRVYKEALIDSELVTLTS